MENVHYFIPRNYFVKDIEKTVTKSPNSNQQFVGRPKIYFPFEERYTCDGKNEEIATLEVSIPTNMIK